MKITVLMSSGDEDEWDDVYDAVPDGGSLIVLGDESPSRPGTFEVREQRMAGGTAYMQATHRKLEAIYAPGMWMKVQFE